MDNPDNPDLRLYTGVNHEYIIIEQSKVTIVFKGQVLTEECKVTTLSNGAIQVSTPFLCLSLHAYGRANNGKGYHLNEYEPGREYVGWGLHEPGARRLRLEDYLITRDADGTIMNVEPVAA